MAELCCCICCCGPSFPHHPPSERSPPLTAAAEHPPHRGCSALLTPHLLVQGSPSPLSTASTTLALHSSALLPAMSRLSALSRLPTAVVASAPRRSMRVSSATVRRPASAIHHHSLSLHVTPALACSASRSFSITHSPSAHQPQLWSLTLIPHRCGAAAELKSRASSSSSSTPSTSSDSSSSDSSSSSSSYSSSIPRLLLLVVSPALLLSWLLCDDRPLQLTRAHAAGSLTADSQPSLSIAPKPHVLAQLAGDDYEVAAWWRRIIAFLVDNTIVSIAFQLVHNTYTLTTHSTRLYLILTIPSHAAPCSLLCSFVTVCRRTCCWRVRTSR